MGRHGRDAGGTERLIGYFVNTLALRLEAPLSPARLLRQRLLQLHLLGHHLRLLLWNHLRLSLIHI